MGVDAFEAEGEFVGDGLAGQAGAGRKQRFHRRRRSRRGRLRLQPVGIAAAGRRARNVDEILDGEGQAIE